MAKRGEDLVTNIHLRCHRASWIREPPLECSVWMLWRWWQVPGGGRLTPPTPSTHIAEVRPALPPKSRCLAKRACKRFLFWKSMRLRIFIHYFQRVSSLWSHVFMGCVLTKSFVGAPTITYTFFLRCKGIFLTITVHTIFFRGKSQVSNLCYLSPRAPPRSLWELQRCWLLWFECQCPQQTCSETPQGAATRSGLWEVRSIEPLWRGQCSYKRTPKSSPAPSTT